MNEDGLWYRVELSDGRTILVNAEGVIDVTCALNSFDASITDDQIERLERVYYDRIIGLKEGVIA